MSRFFSRHAIRFAAISLGLIPLVVTAVPAADATTSDVWMAHAPRDVSGWEADFVDDFKTSINTSVWGRYEGGPAVGTQSIYRRENVVTDQSVQIGDGVLRLSTTQSADGTWNSGGLSSGRGFAATQGKWVLKAKFDRAPGVGYAFLLYPKGGGWPPEVDIAEGTAGGPHIMSTFHHGTTSNHQQVQRWLYGVDMTQWHTYGVVMEGDVMSFTLDGRVYASFAHAATPTMPMWIGMQAGVKDCSKSTGECLSSATPTSSSILIDWVAHYKKI